MVVRKRGWRGAERFPDLDYAALAELRAACRKLTRRLDPGKPLVVFADHGFRIAPEGRRYVHGGPSTLERLVPVVTLPVRS